MKLFSHVVFYNEGVIYISFYFFNLFQSSHGKEFYNFSTLLSSKGSISWGLVKNFWLAGWLSAINDRSNSLFLPIGPGDFLVQLDHLKIMYI